MDRIGSNKELLYVLVGAIVGFALLALYAFSQPDSKLQAPPATPPVAVSAGTTTATYTHRASFGYYAPAFPGLYSGDEAKTGNTLYIGGSTALVGPVRFLIDYQLDGEVTNVVGSYRVLVEIVGNGVSRSYEMAPETAFVGPGFSAEMALGENSQLIPITNLIDNLLGTTGSYNVIISPLVRIKGSVDGQEVNDVFQPRINFAYSNGRLSPNFDQTQVAPEETRTITLASAAPAAIPAPTAQAKLVPNVLRFGPFAFPITTLRSFAVVGLVVSLILLGFYLLSRDRLIRGDPMERVRQQYGPLLIPVQGVNFRDVDRVVEVDTIDNLANIAMALERPILTVERDGEYHFVVQDGGVIYHAKLGRVATVPSTTPISAIS